MGITRFIGQGTRLAVLGAAFLLASCATQQGISVNYAPSSVKTAQGSVEVADFTYSAVNPKTKAPMPPRQIRNTAMGDVILDREVARFVRDAVFGELRFVGVKVNESGKVLKGDIRDFLIDDLGYSIDWTFEVNYVVTDKASGAVAYTGTKTIKRKTEKFGNPLGALNETIKLSVEQLLDDPAFAKAIN